MHISQATLEPKCQGVLGPFLEAFQNFVLL